MGLKFTYIKGQTPLTEEEKEGLLLSTITTVGELNEYEQLNIEKAVEWTLHKKFTISKILSLAFIKNIHKRMYGEVWAWAGDFRKSQKTIGIDWFLIEMELIKLLDDTKYLIQNKAYSPDEVSIRFKHRLVAIHCFPNGNGRHSRLMADILIEALTGEIFSWGSRNLFDADKTRSTYIKSLKCADKGDIKPLLLFSRS